MSFDVQPKSLHWRRCFCFSKNTPLRSFPSWAAKSKATQSQQLLWKAGTIVENAALTWQEQGSESHWAVKDAPWSCCLGMVLCARVGFLSYCCIALITAAINY